METVQIECRCKDCEYYEYHPIYNDFYCTYWDWEEPNCVYEDDFCSNGVRKDK